MHVLMLSEHMYVNEQQDESNKKKLVCHGMN